MLRIWMLCGLLVGLSGCMSGRAFDPVPASGKVSVEGQPLTAGKLLFAPIDTSGEMTRAIGNIEPDGTFQLTTFDPGDGACPGQYRVTIVKPPIEDDEDASATQTTVLPFVPPVDLRITIPEEGTSELEILLATPAPGVEIPEDDEEYDD